MIIRSPKLLNAAQGQPCTLRIVGVPYHDPATTVPCHIPDKHKGWAIKASDISHVHGCAACHDIVDGRVQWQEYLDNKYFYLLRAYQETLENLFNRGVIKIT